MPKVSEPLTLAPEENNAKANLNGVNGNSIPSHSTTTPTAHRYDPNFTQNVINSMGPKTSPRMRKVMGSLIQHIHDFARENEVTFDEWMAGVDFINAAGRMSDDKRNETQLVCDIIGLESLVDEITHKLVSEGETAPTPTAVMGPFWRANAPKREMGTSVVHNMPDGDHTYIHGMVKDYLTGEPIEGAVLDVWHAGPNGLYEQQDPNQVDFNLRGRFTTGRDGRYSFYCIRPAAYSVPQDGPAGKLLELLDRHAYRPGHIHFLITAPKYKSLVTQLYDRTDEHLEDDSVFAVKESLIVDFVPRKGDPEAQFELAYDFQLAASKEAETHSLTGTAAQSRSNGTVNGSGSMSD